MAIPFLNNINLDDNQLQNAKLHVTSSAPAAEEGQIYFHSTNDVINVHDGSAWKTLAYQSWVTTNYPGTVTSVSSATTNQLTVANGSSTPSLSIVTGAVTNGGTALATGDQIYDFVIGLGYTSNVGDITGVNITAGNGLTGTVNTTSGDHTQTINVVGGDGITANVDEIEVSVDDTTIELSASDGTGVVRAKTAAIADGGTGLATADQIHTFVTGFNYLTANQTITLSGDVSGSGATAIAVTINSDAVEAGMLNDNIISGQTALTTGLASTDEFLISDAGAIKKMDVSVLQTYMQDNLTFTSNTNTTYDLNVQAGGANTSIIRLAGSDATNDDVTISGTSTTVKVTESGNTITLDLQDNVTIANDLTVTGDLTVSGSTTTVNTETINLADNIITLNSNYSGSSPTENGGIEVERGTLNNAVLRWNESTDRWQFTNDGGTTYYNIPISTEYNNYTHPTHTARTIDLDATGASVISTIDFTSNTLGHVTSASATTRTLTLGDLGYTGATNADNYGSWTIQDGDTTTYTVTSGDTLQIASGGGITSNFTADDVLTISHNDTSSQASVNNSGVNVIQDVTLDTYGHVTGLASVDLTSGINSLIDTKISATGYAATITDSVSGTAFDHGLGEDVIVQLYDLTTKETVYADVVRNGNYLEITFASTPTNSIRVLVQQIN